MAKENSFDIVSQVDMQEVDNAFQQTRKELTQRYDLKDSGAKVELDKQKHEMTVEAPSDFVAGQVIDIISSKLVKRGIGLGAVKWGEVQGISGGNERREGSVISGIDKDTLTKINKDLKALKLKKGVLVVCILKGAKMEIPNGDSYFNVGDIVYVVTGKQKSIYQLNDIFE